MKKQQLIVVADMEGASGIFERNREALYHEEMYPQGTQWREYGRGCITSDVLAVCEAANAFGIDEILLYDMHFAGCAEPNVQMEKLPPNVRMFDLPNREAHWDRIRGQAAVEPFGIITVGQHARNGESDAYFPHTIHEPIEAFWVNGIHMAEAGQAAAAFAGVPYIANVGCAASHKEAREMSKNVSCISVKDKRRGWEPSVQDTFPIIYDGVLRALKERDQKTAFHYEENQGLKCELQLMEGWYFEAPEDYPWKGSFDGRKAAWETLGFDSAMEIFWRVHDYIRQNGD